MVRIMIEIMSKIKCIKCDYMAKDIEDMMCHIEKEHVDVFNMIESIKNVDPNERGKKIASVIEEMLGEKIHGNINYDSLSDMYALNGICSILELIVY